MSSKRIHSLDAMRVIASFCVVLSHWFDYYGPPTQLDLLSPYYWLGHMVHFPVPFFFIVSGFFIRHSVESGHAPGDIAYRYLTKLAPVFIFWSLVINLSRVIGLRYLLAGDWVDITTKGQTLVRSIIEHPAHFIMTGNVEQLWFLVSLVVGAYWLSWFAGRRRERYLFGIGSAAYLAYLFFYTYKDVFGFNNPPVLWFRAFLTPISMMSLGYEIRRHNICPRKGLSIVLIFAGYIINSIERGILAVIFGSHANYSIMLGTAFIAIGIFFLMLNKLTWGDHPIVQKMAQLTLGIYVAHLWVGEKLWNHGLLGKGEPYWLWVGPAVIWIVTASLVWIGAQSRQLRRFFAIEISAKPSSLLETAAKG